MTHFGRTMANRNIQYLFLMTIIITASLTWFLKPIRMIFVEVPSANVEYPTSAIKHLTIFEHRASKPRIANTILTKYDTDVSMKFQQTIDEKLSAKDPLVIEVVRAMLDAPSHHKPKNSRKVVHTAQSLYIAETYKSKQNGFFIECGALDGERSSNTIWLEQNLMWSGLLIEADPYFYTQLLGKNRRSWSINACLSPYNHTSWMTLSESSGGLGAIFEENGDQRRINSAPSEALKVPCFPLESLLAALNRTTVDYISLDVEGSELSILESIPHSRLNIRTWTIEYDKVGEEKLESFMENNGYRRVEKINEIKPGISLYSNDLVFVKKS